MNTDVLRRLRNFVVRQKIRVDFAMSLLTIVNLSLLIIAVSDKLSKFFGFGVDYYTYWLVVIIVPGAIILIWFVGFILDKYIRYQHTVTTELNERNPQVMEILQEVKKVNARLDQLERK